MFKTISLCSVLTPFSPQPLTEDNLVSLLRVVVENVVSSLLHWSTTDELRRLPDLLTDLLVRRCSAMQEKHSSFNGKDFSPFLPYYNFH